MNKHTKAWLSQLCPEIAAWQIATIIEQMEMDIEAAVKRELTWCANLCAEHEAKFLAELIRERIK